MTDQRQTSSRVDRRAVVLTVASLLLSAGFVAVSLAYNQGRLIPPLDDVYIHLQYGRQLGLGEGFRYNTGDPVTTGASSLLYALLLGAAWFLGFEGTSLLAFAVGFGALCAAAATALTYLLGRRVAGRTVGTWAGVLVVVSGPLQWGAVSGMEVGLVAALTTGAVYAFACEQPGGRFRVTPVVAALLALSRPEGVIVAVGLVAGMAWALGRRRRPTFGTAALASLPVLAALAQLVFYRLATGSAQANGVRAKSWLYQGELIQPLEVADHTLANLRQMAASLTGLSGQDFLPPAALVFAVLGLAALGLGPRTGWRTLAAVLAFGLGVVLVSLSTLITAQWQDLRYVQPFVPLLLLLAVIGVDALARLGGAGTDDGRGRAVVLHGLLTVALLFSVLATPTWALRLAQQATAMREGPVTIGNWLAGNVPPGASVAVNDVGAAAWFGGHRTVDLVGLTTNDMTRPSLNGPGTLYEALRHMPPGQRPDHFAIFDRWGGIPFADLGLAGVLGPEPVITFQLTSPPRPISATAPQTCQIDRTCDKVSVWRADWSLAGTGGTPDRPVPGTVHDQLNVGDLDDEARHDWTPHPPVQGLQPVSSVARTVVAPGRTVADSGRRVVGGEMFTLDGLTPGRPVTLTSRVGPDPERLDPEARAVRVGVDGRPAGQWDLTGPGDATWVQSSFVIPAELVTSPRITVSTGPLQEFLGPYPAYTAYGYWASQ
ncbi:hypothetical protein EV383_3920 [Pseudonocardia sediminis]|uniref:4-amino-4-deoxy-L-arabinose transferase-like glycosyltransferase n=1 Tax=Pseudonocardia sediminis TaxID=1397368 RepID=A0A4Q7UYZ1_PSEST|nr:hypothetical protein [Pseudonocardia sediminis]RZT87015.1 hypothetical protein EV383_3920 [Pseudonocardia sediminis]